MAQGTINHRKVPNWVCETHLRELEDLLDIGEMSEAYEILTDLVQDGYKYCEDCTELRAN